MRLFSNRARPPHLGKYPMEKIRRVARPTTRIAADVPRQPKRANFFNRAMAGDLGAKAKRERARFVNKIPAARAMGRMCHQHLSMHDGAAKPEEAPLPDDLAARAEHIKSLCYFMGADMVGICKVPDHAWYSHDEQGRAIEPYHEYAVVVLVDQGFDTLDAASGDDWISNAQSFRGYMWGSNIACTVAEYIRELGRPARAHTNFDGDVLHIPLLLEAGLGELSRIGELVLNPFLGPRFKSSVITTLNTMVEKRYLRRKKKANSFLFSPRITEEEVFGRVLGDVVDRVFDGSTSAGYDQRHAPQIDFF